MDYCMNVPGFVDSLLILGGKPIQHINWGQPSGSGHHARVAHCSGLAAPCLGASCLGVVYQLGRVGQEQYDFEAWLAWLAG